jgi:hypothetical protein
MTHLETSKSIVCALLAANGCGVILNSLQAVKSGVRRIYFAPAFVLWRAPDPRVTEVLKDASVMFFNLGGAALALIERAPCHFSR